MKYTFLNLQIYVLIRQMVKQKKSLNLTDI